MALTESSPVIVARRDLTVSAGGDGERTVVWMRGEHDISTVAALSETLTDAIALDDADVVVDLSSVEFMGAATVGVIVRARNFLGLRSRSLSLRAPSKCAQRVLDVCGLAAFLDLPPVEAAPGTATSGALATWVAVPSGGADVPTADVPAADVPAAEPAPVAARAPAVARQA